MKTLAKGTSGDCIYKLLKVLINTYNQVFAEAMRDTGAIEDIADKLESKVSLYDDEETKNGTVYNPDVLRDG
jgi:hypothetical protein